MKVKLSGSYRRYRISMAVRARGTLSQRLPGILQEHRFRSIDSARGELQSVGWTAWDGCVPSSFEDLDPWLGSVLYLGVRIDQKRIPAGALRIRRLEAEAAERREVGERIPPARRREITEQIHSELTSRVVPSSAVVPMLWDVERGQLLLGSTAEATNGAFRTLFRASFETAAEHVTSASLPDQLDLPAALREGWVEQAPLWAKGGRS